MTKEEAIEKLRCNTNLGYGIVIENESTQLIKEAIEMAIKELEKDIPKAPKKSEEPRYGMGYEYYDWYCPTCNKFVAFECDIERKNIHHCKCGQRLDWEK